MKIALNGEPREFEHAPSVAELLDRAGFGGRRVAVEVNREIVPRERWRFARLDNGRLADDRTHISLTGGFERGKIYELVYRARDPVVVGIGLAAVRDVISSARYDARSEFPVTAAIAAGISQSGRFLRHFLYQGFNTDEAGRKVFDGMLVHTAGAGRGSFNHRFAQPSRDADPSSYAREDRGGRTGYAHVTEAVRAGAIFVPFVKLADSAANFLTNSACDPVSKIPEYKVCAVRVERLPAA